MTKDNGDVAASGGLCDYEDYGVAGIELDFAGESNTTYTAVGEHDAYLSQWDYNENVSPAQAFYFDPWNFNFFEGQGIYNPWNYEFISPAHHFQRHIAPVIGLGNTYDSVSTIAPTCLVNYNKYYSQAVDAGGNFGKVNMVTSISLAWSKIKSSSDATIIDANKRVSDGSGNYYEKYSESSSGTFAGKGFNTIGSIAITSGPDATKKLRFTKP